MSTCAATVWWSATATWSTSTSVIAPSGLDTSVIGLYLSASGSAVSGLQVATSDDPGLWATPTARIPLIGGKVAAPWLPDGADVWTALQDVVGAYAGACWTNADGVLTVLNRTELAGVNRPKTLVDVDTEAEDVVWNLSTEDAADRLEVTWWPVSWPDEWSDPPEWPVGDKISVPAGESLTVEVDLGGYVETLAGWTSYAAGDGTSSEWEANTAENGTGAEVTSGIAVTNDRLSPSRVRVTVRNSTSGTVWMVDGDGAPAMILRGTRQAAQDTPRVITYGATEVTAQQTVQVDLGKTVQDAATAAQLAAYIWARVRVPRYTVGSLRLPLDWTRDLGQILALEHPASGMSVHALVTRISLDAGPGAVNQLLDLVILPPTFDDLDATWKGSTSAAFDAAWFGRNGADFDRTPLAGAY